MLRGIVKKIGDWHRRKHTGFVVRKIMRSSHLSLERFYSKHNEDEIRPVGLNPYMKKKVKEIKTVDSFLGALPPEAKTLTHEEIVDLRNYRQIQLASSVEDVYEATHALATVTFDYAPAIEVLVNRICNRSIEGERNHLAVLMSVLSGIVRLSQEDEFGRLPLIHLSDRQRKRIMKQIEYIDSMRGTSNATDNS